MRKVSVFIVVLGLIALLVGGTARAQVITRCLRTCDNPVWTACNAFLCDAGPCTAATPASGGAVT